MKKRLKSLLRTVLVVGAMALMMTSTALAGQWKQDNVGWWYQNDDGSYPANEWLLDNGKWYFFDNTGYMVANRWEGNYYLGADGAMLVNTTTPDGYVVGADGAWDGNSAQQETITTPTAFSNLVYPVDVISGCFGVNTVGGISPYIGFRNNSEKTVQYITFEMTPYDDNGNLASCIIRGHSTTSCKSTGPYYTDKGIGIATYTYIAGLVPIFDHNTNEPYYYTTRTYKKTPLDEELWAKTFNNMPGWECVWYNDDIFKIKVTKATIEYTDGTSDILDSLNITLYHDSLFD